MFHVFDEKALLARLGPGYRSAPADVGYDIIRGAHAIEVKSSLESARDLRAALLQLAYALTRDARLERATLVARLPRMSGVRLLEEWKQLGETLRPAVMSRLGIVALAADRAVAIPESADLLAIARGMAESDPASLSIDPVSWSWKAFEVWKVLLDEWLSRRRPTAIRDLADRSECSYPTVASVVDRLERCGEITRASNRSVSLRGFPRRSLGEILPFANAFRGTVRFIDETGRPPDPEGLLRRMRKRLPSPDIAFGGVVAARHHVKDFDLNGLPRLDVTISNRKGLAWLAAIAPGLGASNASDRPPLLVVHQSPLEKPHFESVAGEAIPLVDRAETLLDLYDLRLTAQIEEFVAAARGDEP